MFITSTILNHQDVDHCTKDCCHPGITDCKFSETTNLKIQDELARVHVFSYFYVQICIKGSEGIMRILFAKF